MKFSTHEYKCSHLENLNWHIRKCRKRKISLEKQGSVTMFFLFEAFVGFPFLPSTSTWISSFWVWCFLQGWWLTFPRGHTVASWSAWDAPGCQAEFQQISLQPAMVHLNIPLPGAGPVELHDQTPLPISPASEDISEGLQNHLGALSRIPPSLGSSACLLRVLSGHSFSSLMRILSNIIPSIYPPEDSPGGWSRAWFNTNDPSDFRQAVQSVFSPTPAIYPVYTPLVYQFWYLRRQSWSQDKQCPWLSPHPPILSSEGM